MGEIIAGSRGSALALHQTNFIIDALRRVDPALECRIEVIRTIGDKITDLPLGRIPDKGLFVTEIEQALLRGEIDFAVHSAKDLPTEIDDALCVAAYPEREDPSDALVSKSGGLADLPPGATVGTSSVRRRAQILAARPDLTVADLRGNIDTRLRKVETPDYDAVVLAAAGLRRMGWDDRITEMLPHDICLPAVAQGALAVQCRRDNPIRDLIHRLDCGETRACVTAEREFLAAVNAGCQTPAAGLARITDEGIRLDAMVASLDGTQILRASAVGDATDPAEVGRRVAEELISHGALKLIAEVRASVSPKPTGAA